MLMHQCATLAGKSNWAAFCATRAQMMHVVGQGIEFEDLRSADEFS